MIDAVVKAAIEEALRFLQPGDTYTADVNEHTIVAVALRGGLNVRGYLVACGSCGQLLHVSAPRPFILIHNHTKHEEEEKPDAHLHARKD